MDNNTKKISRSELYEQVWTVAITKLSKKYGLSDVGLAKICKKNNIPRPPRGYWAKKAAGYNMKRLPLPPGENVTIAITPNPYSRNANKNRELVARISPSIQSEGDSEQILTVLRKVAGKLNIKNADERKKVKLNKAVFLSEEFKQLWERIKYKTTFRVDFNSKKLIEKCADEIRKTLIVGRARFITRTAMLDVDRGGVSADVVHETTSIYDARDYDLPDLVSYLQNETNLTRRSIVDIILGSGRLKDFKNNPQKFIEQVGAIIKRQMRIFIVDGIRYQKIGNQHYYAQELFKENELYGYLRKNMLESKKSVFDHVVYDSDVEADFAKSFELSDDVKVYAKLPGWFKIDTPLGSYNPDWAVLVELDGQPRLYFVVESKGSLFSEALRVSENAKIQCGREHFKTLESDVGFMVANNYSTFSEQVSSIE